MKGTLIKTFGLLSLGSVLMFSQVNPVLAEEHSTVGDGHVQFEGEGSQGIRDPENPGTVVDPGGTPSTSGALRIDFVPKFNFSMNKISNKDTSYPINAQLFHDGTAARGNYIQVTDVRGNSQGWTLQLRQETQFQNPDTPNRQLDGAYLSLDHSWVNSTQPDNLAPSVSKEVIHLDNIGATYNLAEATKGTGDGTWLISFGASSTNPKGIQSTLKPRVDEKNNPVLDSSFENQQVQENSGITLSIPGATKKDPVTYQTVLTWILAELP